MRYSTDELAGFTTDELAAWLCGDPVSVPARIVPGSDDKYFRDAIIARLRAGDAAERLADAIDGLIDALRKAIAAYEGKED